MNDQDYAAIYSIWGELPDWRIHIRIGDCHERLWGKELPDGTFGLNNNPLEPAFRFQDIVLGLNVISPDQLIHRRWNTQIYYRANLRSQDERSPFFEALKDLGETTFFDSYLGSLMFESTDEQACRTAMRTALETLGLDFEMEPSSDEEDVGPDADPADPTG